MTLEENKQVVGRAFEALMAGDLQPVQDLLAPDAVLHQCGFLKPMPVRVFISGAAPGMRIEDRRLRIERMIGEGDLVAVHWTTTGRNSAPDEP